MVGCYRRIVLWSVLLHLALWGGGLTRAPAQGLVLHPHPGRLQALAALPDGAVLAVGEVLWPQAGALPGAAPQMRGLVARLGADGLLCWSRTYACGTSCQLTAVAALPDGGALALGSCAAVAAGPRSAWALCLDAQGAIRWQWCSDPSQDRIGVAVAAAAPDYLVVVLRQTDQQQPHLQLVQLDAAGQARWLATPEDGPLIPARLQLLPQQRPPALTPGALALTASQPIAPCGTRPLVLWLDPAGRLLRRQVLGAAGSVPQLLALADGLLAGWTGLDLQQRAFPQLVWLTADGYRELPLARQVAGDVELIGLAHCAVAGQTAGPVVLGLNVTAPAAAGQVWLQLLAAFPPVVVEGVARPGAVLRLLQDVRGEALLLTGSTLLLAGAAPAGPAGGRPWLYRMDLAEIDGESLALGPVTVAPPQEGEWCDPQLLLTARNGAMQLLAERWVPPEAAWPWPVLRGQTLAGEECWRQLLPYANGRICWLQPLPETAEILVGVTVPAVPGPAALRLLRLSSQGVVQQDWLCGEWPGQIDGVQIGSAGALLVQGRLETPAGPQLLRLSLPAGL
ncbi:MAG: hypothetical protein PHV45_02070 [Desulfuromonas thiophila]|nr:hypothetical protein [Desulfuromonas thiophila]